MQTLKTITPDRAAALVGQGAVLIDVREAHEHEAEHIPGARHHALSKIDPRRPIETGNTVLIFHCKSGGRTSMNASKLLASAGECEAFVLGGGIEAWRRAGLPTTAATTAKTAEPGGLIRRISRLFS